MCKDVHFCVDVILQPLTGGEWDQRRQQDIKRLSNIFILLSLFDVKIQTSSFINPKGKLLCSVTAAR